MSDGSPGSRKWPPAPNFRNAPRGYWAHEVDGLLDDLKASDQAGEPLDPIIDAREIPTVHHIHQDTVAPRSRWRVRRSRKRAAMPVHRSAEMEAVLAEIDRA